MPLLLEKNKIAEIVCKKLNIPCEEPDLSEWVAMVEKERALKFRFYKDKLTYIATHYELRRFFSELTNIEPALLKFNFESNKKPYLKEFPIDFNISHSINFFSILIADKPDQKVGVDIEKYGH